MGNPFNSITLSQLYNFHVLSKTLHFTEAARGLYITQPTLSASIKALETELDTPLLIREGRRNVRLTKHGKELDEKLEVILKSLEEILEETRKKGNETNAVLNLGTIPTIQDDFLPALLSKYWSVHNYDSKIRITVEFSLPLIKGLRQQDYEVIFAAYVPEESDLEFIPMLTKRMVAVVNKTSHWAKKDSFSLKYLNHAKYSTYCPDTPIGNATNQLLEKYETPPPTLAFDDEFMLSSTVVANKEIIGIMLDTFQIDPFKNNVKILPIEEVDANWHSICLVYDPRVHQSKTARQFIDIARFFSKEYITPPPKNNSKKIQTPKCVTESKDSICLLETILLVARLKQLRGDLTK